MTTHPLPCMMHWWNIFPFIFNKAIPLSGLNKNILNRNNLRTFSDIYEIQMIILKKSGLKIILIREKLYCTLFKNM